MYSNFAAVSIHSAGRRQNGNPKTNVNNLPICKFFPGGIVIDVEPMPRRVEVGRKKAVQSTSGRRRTCDKCPYARKRVFTDILVKRVVFTSAK